MLASFLLSFREGLEAALVLGIVLVVLRRLRQPSHRKYVWFGAAFATLLSLGVGVGLYFLGVSFEGRAEAIFEGVAMLSAAAVLTWMIFWMERQGRSLQAEIEEDVKRVTTSGSRWGVFWISFLAVLREGIELSLFLTAAAFSVTASVTIIGGLVGLGVAALVGWILFATSSRLNVGSLFRVSSILLLFFAAGLVAHGVHEFNEAGLIPSIIDHVWDVNPILDETSLLGQILKSTLGYNGNPSLTEIAAYGVYLLVVVTIRQVPRRLHGRPPVLPSSQAVGS